MRSARRLGDLTFHQSYRSDGYMGVAIYRLYALHGLPAVLAEADDLITCFPSSYPAISRFWTSNRMSGAI